MDLIVNIFVFVLIFSNLANIEFVQGICIVINVNNTSEFQFKDQQESEMRDCIMSSKFLMKSLKIDSPFLTNIRNVITGYINTSRLETLTVTNGNISIFDISNLALPSLKTLSLPKNEIESFLFPNSNILEILNISYNKITEWNPLNYPNLLTLDLSHNDLNSFNFKTASLKFIYFSNAFSKNISSKFFQSTNNIEFMDLSKNYLSDISFLFVHNLNKLDLSFNKIQSLWSIELLTKSFTDLTINLSENPLQCSMDITKDWLNLKMRHILFTEELQCAFERSSSKYSISKYGWMLDKEELILTSIWNGTLLEAYTKTKLIKFSSITLSKGVKVGWSLEMPLDYSFVVSFLSAQKREIFSKNIRLMNDQIFEILFTSASSVTETCFLLNIPKVETTGSKNINVTITCINSLPFNSSSVLSPLGYIIVIVFLVVLSVSLIGAFVYFKFLRPSSRTREINNSIPLEMINANKETMIRRDRGTLSEINNNNNNSNNSNSNPNPNNNNNVSIINNTNSDKSSLIALNMINQALNFSLLQPNPSSKPLKISPSIQYPDVQKFNENKMSNPNPFLISEYQKIKQLIDKSGMLLPNEKLVTKNRGECYWANCFFQSDIEENFKKHLNECHHMTTSALAQLEISFEKAMQLSKLLLNEQNHLYNMFLHLDQKLKSLPNDNCLLLNDSQYLAALLNKFKQMPNIFDFFADSNRFNGDLNSFHPSHRLDNHQFTISNASHHTQQPSPHQQQSPLTVPALSSIPQQLIDNLSSVLMRQQQQQQPPQLIPLSSQNSNQQPNFQQSIASPPQLISQQTHSAFTNNILPLINANNNINSLLVNSSDPNLINISPNNQLNNIDNNLKDILSQSRSSDSNYPRSDPESNHVKNEKIKPIKRASSNSQLSFFPKGMTDREYYRQFPVRPSASYVNLIKTAILESPRRELSLNEIYVWMQTEFAYFRDKEQKWKNAIRHNLSLHKCFQRKHGKLWTFNENEYNMKKSRNRFQYNVPIPGAENQTNDPDSYEDEEDPQEQLDSSEYMIKKEMEFNDENMPEDKHLEIDEWSNYLHKTSLISSSDDNMKPPDISVD